VTVVIAKCVGCGHEKEVQPREVPAGELPMCPKCYCVMYAKEAKS
jgi:hypothetical protein